jgi:signal transduction histidine kinase
MKELSLNILDIVQNSIRAEANEIFIEIKESVAADLFSIRITDNGCGIPEEILEKVTDPFVTTRTKRRMGLGLALLKYHSELAGGYLKIKSLRGKGTEVLSCMSFAHIDRQPLGDIAGVIKILIAANPGINFIFRLITDSGEYRFSSAETMEYLEVDDFNQAGLLDEICSMIKENLMEIEVSGCIINGKEK